MKFAIYTHCGSVEAMDAKPVRFDSPKWLSNYQFFTARPYVDGNHVPVAFRMTEVSTGWCLPGTWPSRVICVRAGKAAILAAGKKNFEAALKRAKRNR